MEDILYVRPLPVGCTRQKMMPPYLPHDLADQSEICDEVKWHNTELVQEIWTKSVDIDFIVCIMTQISIVFLYHLVKNVFHSTARTRIQA